MLKEQTTAEISVAAKERLARLLATENVTVEHRNVPTAAFDIKNRVLILPQWKDITKDIYDLLVLHEVGHALFTPLDGWHDAISDKGPNFKSFLNVLEDARIEKKMKRKFPGGRKAFTQGYKELLDRDFFGTRGRDVNTYGLIDRINIHFKAGSLLGINFDGFEQGYVDRIGAAETWDEIVEIAEELWDEASNAAETDTSDTDVNFGPSDDPSGCDDDDNDDNQGEGFGPDSDDPSEDEGEEGESLPFGNDDPDGESDTDGDSPMGNGSGLEDEDGEDSDSSQDASDGKSDEEFDATTDNPAGDGTSEYDGESPNDSEAEAGESPSESSSREGGVGGGDGKHSGEPWSETDRAWREKEEDLVDEDAPEILYTQIPRDDAFLLDNIVIPHAKVWEGLTAAIDHYVNGSSNTATLDDARKDLQTFKSKNSKVVGYLAKEFEMRKAADASARASTSRTGVLDTNTLHSFKWNDDVFKKVTNLPDGKSHGLQMFVDWSGSMSSNMQGSLEQILNLVMFCKKVNIPFDVYAFSDTADRGNWVEDKGTVYEPRMDRSKLQKGDWIFRRSSFKLVQLASSSAKGSAFNNMLLGLIILRGAFNNRGHYGDPENGVTWFPTPGWLGLGGTPLNEAVLTAIPLVNAFRAKNGLQIVNTVFLTDGCGSGFSDIMGADGNYEHVGWKKSILRDPATRTELAHRNGTETFLEMFRIRTGSKIVNFYVTNPRRTHFMREAEEGFRNRDGGWDNDIDESAIWKTAQAEGGIAIEGGNGWDELYLLLGGDKLSIGDEGLSEDLVGAKKGALKRAFGKAASGKLRNRVVLRRFSELIAA